jgi:hypothetical protein
MWDTPWSVPGSEYEATAKKIKACPTKHLALEHFQTIDLAFHRPITPSSCDPRFDCGIVVREPLGEPLQGAHSTQSGACQPRIEPRWLPSAYKLGKILGQINRLGQLGLLCMQEVEL